MVRPSTPVRIVGLTIGILTVATLAACSGSSSGGGSPTTSANSTATSTTTATATVTKSVAAPVTKSSDTHTTSDNGGNSNSGGSSGNGGGGSTSDTGADCKESQLRAQIEAKPVAGSGEHGRRAVIVEFINKSNSTCVLYGYPGAAVLNGGGLPVKQAKRTVRGDLLGYAPGHNSLVNVSLDPGAVAKAGIEGTDQQRKGAANAGCDGTVNPEIEVTPPNTKTAVTFDVGWPDCYSFTVHPVNYN